jgi:hypothetical protein
MSQFYTLEIHQQSSNDSGSSTGSGNEPESFKDDENCGLLSIRRIAPLVTKQELDLDYD